MGAECAVQAGPSSALTSFWCGHCPVQTSVVSKIKARVQASIVSAGMSSVFLRQAARLPLVIMGENTSQDLKMASIRVGAVDILEKPLSLLKLRNIWQHTVRKVRVAEPDPPSSLPVTLCACFLDPCLCPSC